jgi:hypothetical protein
MAAEFTELLDITLYLLLALGAGAVIAVFTVLLIIVVAALSLWVGDYVTMKLTKEIRGATIAASVGRGGKDLL